MGLSDFLSSPLFITSLAFFSSLLFVSVRPASQLFPSAACCNNNSCSCSVTSE